jgi:hypothetical protein
LLPAYVPRAHDARLREIVDGMLDDGRSRLITLVGGSSTGKPAPGGSLARMQEQAGDDAGADRIRRFGLLGSGEIASKLDFARRKLASQGQHSFDRPRSPMANGADCAVSTVA